MLTDFQNSFTVRLSDEVATNWFLNMPPHTCFFILSECPAFTAEYVAT